MRKPAHVFLGYFRYSEQNARFQTIFSRGDVTNTQQSGDLSRAVAIVSTTVSFLVDPKWRFRFEMARTRRFYGQSREQMPRTFATAIYANLMCFCCIAFFLKESIKHNILTHWKKINTNQHMLLNSIKFLLTQLCYFKTYNSI